MIKNLGSFAIKHTACVSVATLTAFVLNHFFSFSHEYWMFLTAFIVSQTTRGAPLRQSLLYLCLMIAASILFSLLLTEHSMLLIQNRFLDVLIGGMIGLFFTLFMFAPNPENEFKAGVMPVLTYLLDTEKYLFPAKNFYADFPNWIYEVGFNPGLRAGFRFYLLQLERVADLFFSMHYLAEKFDDARLQDLNQDLALVGEKNRELLFILLTYFQGKKLEPLTYNYVEDMQVLEKKLQEKVPASLELLDLSAHYMPIIAYVRDIKDMRHILLQLVAALPA